jgi:peptide/nickel transport system permease protein
VTWSRAAGATLLCIIAGSAVAAPVLTTHTPVRQYVEHAQAPPMWPRIIDREGQIRRPFVYAIRLVDRLERRYEEDRARPMTIRWFAGGAIASIDETQAPWFVLGTDPVGRDVLTRLLFGTRVTLSVACVAAIGALALGIVVGAPAGFFGGRIDTGLMALADFVLVLPAMYVVLAIRAALPLVLSVQQVFAALAVILMAAGWPLAARGVRVIVRSERRKEYAEAAYAMGAGRLRILLRHLLPAASGFLAVTGTMLVPAFILAESTLSLVGFGFPVPTATWGTLLRDAWESRAFVEAPWLMAPAGAVTLTVLSLHLLTSDRTEEGGRAGTFF